MTSLVKLSELVEAVDWVSEDQQPLIDLESGHVVFVDSYLTGLLEEGDEEALAELPDWQQEGLEIARAVLADTGRRFMAVPDRFDFHEYRQMERFIGTVEDTGAAEALRRAIKGRGAFGRFKDAAARLDLLERWFRYRDDALRDFVRDWAEVKGLAFEDDTGDRKP